MRDTTMGRGAVLIAALCLALGAAKDEPAPKDPPGVVRMTAEQQKPSSCRPPAPTAAPSPNR